MLSSAAFLPARPLHFKRQYHALLHNQCSVKPLSANAVSYQSLGNDSVAFVLSHFEAHDLLSLQKSASKDGAQLVRGEFSVDIGKRALESVLVRPDGISLNDEKVGSRVLATWGELKRMSKKGKTGAYEVFCDGVSQPEKIAGLSDATNMPASLLPISPRKPPTLILGGYGMHRMKDTDPAADTDSKIAAIGATHLHGHVLDICTGLGYTAIAASRSSAVADVTTIELDPFVIEVQRRNPWSQELFSSPKLRRVVGNAVEAVKDLPNTSFDAVIHDPPAQVLGGDLYGLAFYEELHRVCVRGGKLFHYVGDPNSIESGRLFPGIMKRLQNAGFREITKSFSAYGLTAIRG